MGLRLVLDTNVWLDWLVFDDPGVRPLKAVVAAGEADVFMAADCQQELERVISYPLGRATLDASAQAACLEEYRRVVSWLQGSPREPATRLPVCRDPADQNFGFCGHGTADNSPYCAEHARVAFQPAKKRERRAREFDYIQRLAG